MHDRRSFLKGTLAGVGLAVVAPRLSLARSARDRVELGKTGIRCSLLAQGTGFHGWGGASDHTRLGQPSFTKLLRHSLDEGVNFVDMADQYGSHTYVRRGLEGVSRDKVVLLTKIHPRGDGLTRPGATADTIDRFRREIGSEMIDVCLIHCVTNDRWLEDFKRVRDDLSALRDKGVLRAVGVSCHDHGALKLAATDPWIQVVFARINHRGGREFECDDTRDEVAKTLRLARKNGKAVVGMKIFGAGKLTSAEDRDASLRYVLGEDLVDAMTIGMTTPEQVGDTARRIDKALAI